MSKLKRNLALAGATAVIATFGVGGIMTAQADTGTPTGSVVQKSGAEKGETTEVADGADEGPDANPDEPGHQDANESGEAADTETAAGAEAPEGAESATETADGADKGPDANPNEPGHQDANETGESN